MKLPLFIRHCMARIEGASSGYLDHVGWFHSRAERAAIDPYGEPMPWFTYPAVQFLADRVRSNFRVLEFGAGMGTIWWSKHVREVVAIEHDPEWANQVAKKCSARLIRVSADNADTYTQAARNTGSYQIIVVDGIFRNECLTIARDLLSSDGVIVLDDAQRDEYRTVVDCIRRSGFRALELHGPQPVSKHPGCTAFFYRDENVLGL